MNKFCLIDNSKMKRDHLFRDGLHLLENGKVILANDFIYYLNSIYSVNFDRNLLNLVCRGLKRAVQMGALQKKLLGGITVILMFQKMTLI